MVLTIKKLVRCLTIRRSLIEDISACPAEGHIWFAIIGTHTGTFYRGNKSIKSTVRNAARWHIKDFRIKPSKLWSVNVLVSDVPDESLSWDHQGFHFADGKTLTYEEAKARCFQANSRGEILRELVWKIDQGWI